MKNIKLIEKFLILNKKNEFNNPDIDDIKRFIERQIEEIKEWKWNTEDHPFSIILEKKDNLWNKLEIFAWIDWEDFILELHVNKWIKTKILIFFNKEKKKFSKNINTISEVIEEVKKFNSKNEDIYRDEFMII